MTGELIKEEPKRIIKLGNKKYKLSPLNLNILANIEEEFNCGMDKVGELLAAKQATALRSLVYILLKDNYPELTKVKIGEFINLDNLEEISKEVGEALTVQ